MPISSSQEPPTEGRRERKKRELRARIYQSAARLFVEQGFEETTVEQIANAADVAQATFFNHFVSKDALLGEMTAEVFRIVTTLVEQERKQLGSTQQQLARMADKAALIAVEVRTLTRDILLELMRNTARPGHAGPVLARVHETFKEFLRDGQARGDVRTDLEPQFLAEMLVGAFEATVINWVNDPDYPLEDRMRRAAQFIGESFAPRRGTSDR